MIEFMISLMIKKEKSWLSSPPSYRKMTYHRDHIPKNESGYQMIEQEGH